MRPIHALAFVVILLPLAACGGGGSSSGGSGPVSPPPPPPPPPPPASDAATIAYGGASLQVGDLRLPDAAQFGPGPYPVAVMVHGGCWTAGVGTKTSTTPLAQALTKRGIATWNIEYRAVGDSGGGYPGTFQDWSAATDKVRDLATTYPLDLGHVIVLGHSAGGHAALWIAARSRLPAGNSLSTGTPLPIFATVDLDGPGELRPDLGYNRGMCGDAAERLMGGTATTVPDRFALASPSELLPLGVKQYVVSATFVQLPMATRYRDMAVAKGDSVTIVDQSTSGHFPMITPGTAEELQVEDLVVSLLTAP